MPPALRGSPGTQAVTAGNVASPANLVPTLPAHQAGDLLLCFTAVRSGSSGSVATPSGWTELLNVNGTWGRMALYGKIAASSSETNPTVTWSNLVTGTSGTPAMAQCTVWTGMPASLTGIVDVTGTVETLTSNTAAASGASVTTTVNDDLVLALSCRQDDAGTWSAPSGFTLIAGLGTTSGADMGFAWAYQVKGTAGSVAPADFGLSGASSFASAGVLIALEAAIAALSISPTGLDSAGDFGDPTVTTGPPPPQTVQPDGVPSAQAFGPATIPQTVEVAGVMSGTFVPSIVGGVASDPEDIVPNGTFLNDGTVVGAATSHAALSDDSDSSYVEQVEGGQTRNDYGNLVGAAGRTVTQFHVIVRTNQVPTLQAGSIALSMTGATITGGLSFSQSTTITDRTLGPFTRTGGGNFTEAMMNSLRVTVTPGPISAGGTGYIYKVTVRATYEAAAPICGDGHVVGGSVTGLFGTPTVKNITTAPVGGVSSAQAFGTVTITTVVRPVAGGVPSAAAFGTVTIRTAIVRTVTGLGSAQAFGAPTVTTTIPGSSVTVGSVATAQAFGTVTFRLSKPVGGVSSAQQFGVPSTKHTKPVTGLGTAQQFGTVRFLLTKQVSGVGSAQQFGVPTFKLGKAVGGVSSAQAFGTLTIRAVVTRSVTGVATAQAFGTPKFNITRTIPGLGTAQQFGAPTFSVVGGPTTVGVVGLASAQQFGALTFRTTVTRQVTGVPSASAFGTPTTRTVIVKPAGGVSSAQAFGTPVVTTAGGAAQTVEVPGVLPQQPAPSITGAVICGDGHVVGGIPGQFGFVTFHTTVTVQVGSVQSAQQFGVPWIAFDQVVEVGGCPSSGVLGKPRVGIFLKPAECTPITVTVATCTGLVTAAASCENLTVTVPATETLTASPAGDEDLELVPA